MINISLTDRQADMMLEILDEQFMLMVEQKDVFPINHSEHKRIVDDLQQIVNVKEEIKEAKKYEGAA